MEVWIPILSVVVGGLLGALISRLEARHSASLRVDEKIAEKRIAAHEQVLSLAQELRTMDRGDGTRLGALKNRTPKILRSDAHYAVWRGGFGDILNRQGHWLTDPVLRQLYLMQDYFINLDSVLEVGNIDRAAILPLTRADFIPFAAELEAEVVRFLRGGARAMRFRRSRGHKYPSQENLRRLASTHLFSTHGSEIAEAHHQLGG